MNWSGDVTVTIVVHHPLSAESTTMDVKRVDVRKTQAMFLLLPSKTGVNAEIMSGKFAYLRKRDFRTLYSIGFFTKE